MFKAMAKVSTKLDKTSSLAKSLKKLSGSDVYVGIPEGDNGDHAEISNPELMYVLTHGVRSGEMIQDMQPKLDGGILYTKAFQMYLHEHGSPLWKVPPRPVIEPAIEHNRELIAKQLKNTAITVLNGNDPTTELQKAGMIGMNAARDWFTNPKNDWPQNAASTIKQKGSSNPNIDTGELRKSITYVVKNND